MLWDVIRSTMLLLLLLLPLFSEYNNNNHNNNTNNNRLTYQLLRIKPPIPRSHTGLLTEEPP